MIKDKQTITKLIFLFCIILFSNLGCSFGPIQKNDILHIEETQTTGYGNWEVSYSSSSGNTYYLSDATGIDTNNGSLGSPWKTLAHAQSTVISGDTIIILDSANYGAFSESGTTHRTDWITYKAETGQTPVFSNISISYPSLSNAYLRFDGINVTSAANNVFNIRYARFVDIRNCGIHQAADNKYLASDGINMRNCEYILVYHNDIHSSMRGISTMDTMNVTIYGNHIHGLGGGTGFQYTGGCENFIFQMNNVHDSNYDPLDPEAPTDPHSSAVSIRSNDILIKQNIFHDIGTSSGIMCYEPDAAGGEPAYSNITIENNLMYDISNTLLIIDGLGENFIIRNNTLIGRLRTDIDNSVYKLQSGISIDVSPGFDGSGLYVYNNIVAAMVSIPGPNLADIQGNIFWSFYYDETSFDFISTLAGNTIITEPYEDPIPYGYFTSSFFNDTDFNDSLDFYQDQTIDPGQFYDFTLAASSPAYNYNNTSIANQSIESLGSTTLANGEGFILNNGQARDASHHSAGCYERP